MAKSLALRLLGYQWIAVVIQAVISFGLSILVARGLEPEQFGVYAIATSAGVFVTIFLEGGFNTLLQRESARGSLSETVTRPLSSYALGYALIAGAVLLGLVLINPFEQDRQTLLSIVCAYLPLVMVHFSMFVLRGQGRLAKDALLQVLTRSATALAVLTTLMFGFQTPASILFAQGAGAAFIYCLLLKKVRVVPSFCLPYSLIRAIGPILLLSFVGAVASKSDLLICRVLDVPRGDIGNYGVALRLVEAAQVFAGPVGFLLLRKFRLSEMNQSAHFGMILSYAGLAMTLGLVVLLGNLAFADFFVSLFFGAMYSEAASLLKVLSGGLVFFFGNIALSQAAMALELERWTAIGTLIIAMGNALLNFSLIPAHGVMASAWIAVATQMLLMGWLVCGVKNSMKGRDQ